MVQHTIDSISIGTESGLTSADKPLPVAAKKTVLRDVQNETQSVVTNAGTSLRLKEKGPAYGMVMVSGTKRTLSEGSISPPHHQSPHSDAGNGHLVYVRRKSEAEVVKSTSDTTSNNIDSMRKLHLAEEAMQQKAVQLNPQIKEPEISCFSVSQPASLMNASVKSSYSPPLVYSGIRSAENNCGPIVTANPSSAVPKELKEKHWEERYLQLQILLKHLDQSDQEDYLQMLRSLSSVELSRHAFELEKKSIQLSLEEAQELKRVGVLNLLGKSTKMFKAS